MRLTETGRVVNDRGTPAEHFEMRRVLKPGGRLAVIDCHKQSLPFGPPVHIRLSSEEVKEMMERCDFRFSSEVDLGYNYMVQFTA